MPYLCVNLHRDHPNASFDPDSVLETLEETFPDIEVQEGEQLSLRLERAKKVLTSGSEAEQAVLAKMKRDATTQGPARAFTLTIENQKIQGVVKRHMFQLLYDTPLSEETLRALKALIYSFHPLGDQMNIEVAND